MNKSMKEELLEELKKEMLEMRDMEKGDMFKDLMPIKEGVEKVTVMSDSPEGLKKGLSKAQEIMAKKLGEESVSEESEEYEDDDEYECPKCKGKENCECE